jgi:hypothetical protein
VPPINLFDSHSININIGCVEDAALLGVGN